MDINDFLRVYTKLANNQASEREIDMLYEDLLVKSVGTEYSSFLMNCSTRVDKALAVDAIASLLHRDPSAAIILFGSDIDLDLISKSLDGLSGLEDTVDIRRLNRNYFSTLKSADHFEILD